MVMKKRTETRAERYSTKVPTAFNMPVEVATVNFMCDGNLGFVMRAMACFGARELHVVGSVPAPNELSRLSGGVNKFINIHQYGTPSEFVRASKRANMPIISAELDPRAVPLHAAKIHIGCRMVVVLGHEETGVPEEILHQSDQIIYIPMPGIGYCLNTSQAGNIILYELSMLFRGDVP